MEIQKKIVDNNLYVKLIGELDHSNCEEVRNSIDKDILITNVQNIIFDFEKLDFMDSSGIGVILGRYKKICMKKGQVAIINMNASVKNLYDICGLKKIIHKYDNLEQAYKIFGGI